ncbi:CCR4-NOT transcription complex subunit 3-like [Impatiens glandulifera]|uniref:CCR4-NOT transcription complex subunit 3-like n=1 Tax=Impatiens glandulifera TaxID=253017 RepID=UPI001FB0708C|nr:CCR4-NOT transcription complex subunit 3-like [Impatiens glandulifera]
MAFRKIQAEVDLLLKKVQEHADAFDNIMNKLQDADSTNQKERFENDLKKVIKKLQRCREQIKTRIQSNEVKDKKISDFYLQGLLDSRKVIENLMDTYKIFEKESKTKAFSIEGLGQQPKTDPKEKAKLETREWLNNGVNDLESQIDSFEAEMEGLPVKKGKKRPPRLTHLEKSIVRHKAHIVKLELILRLLDNDQLSPEQVNEVKDLLDDYVERNQDNFDEFSEVDELYSSLELDKLEAIEDLVTTVPPFFPKVGGASGKKTSYTKVPCQSRAGGASGKKPSYLTVPWKSPVGGASRTTVPWQSKVGGASGTTVPWKSSVGGASGTTVPWQSKVGGASGTTVPWKSSVGGASGTTVPWQSKVGGASGTNTSLTTVPWQSTVGGASGTNTSLTTVPWQSTVGGVSGTETSLITGPVQLTVGGTSGTETSLTIMPVELSVGGASGTETSFTTGPVQSTVGDASGTETSLTTGPVQSTVGGASGAEISLTTGSVQSTVTVSSIQKSSSVQEQAEETVVRTPPPKISSNISSAPVTPSASNTSPGNTVQSSPINIPISTQKQVNFECPVHKPFPSPSDTSVWGMAKSELSSSPSTSSSTSEITKENVLGADERVGSSGMVQVLETPSSNRISSADIGNGAGTAGRAFSPPAIPFQNQNDGQFHGRTEIAPDQKEKFQQVQQQGVASFAGGNHNQFSAQQSIPLSNQLPTSVHSQFAQQASLSAGLIDTDVGLNKVEETQQSLSVPSSVPRRNPMNDDDDDDLRATIARLPRDIDLLGVDDIGDDLEGSTANSVIIHDTCYSLQMLEAAYHKIPQPKDSEREKVYVPKNPVVTPSSYPQVKAPILETRGIWDKLSSENLFFVFYFQENSYQQLCAAIELKKRSWRYHMQYNVWFQRLEEPTERTPEFECGSYYFFDYRMPDYNLKSGWCFKLWSDFTFEYIYLEEELDHMQEL